MQNRDIHGFATRNRHNFCIPNARRMIAYNSPRSLGVKIFNHLSEDIRSSHSLVDFKNKLNAYLIVECFYSIDEFFSYVSNVFKMSFT